MSEPKIPGFNASALFPNTDRQARSGTRTVHLLHTHTHTQVGRELGKSESPPETSLFIVSSLTSCQTEGAWTNYWYQRSPASVFLPGVGGLGEEPIFLGAGNDSAMLP